MNMPKARVESRVEVGEEFMPMVRIFSEVDTLIVTSGKRTLKLTIDDFSHFHTIAESERGVV